MPTILQLRLFNFKIPEDLKNQFHLKCQANRTPMSAELTRFIRQYVKDDDEQTPRAKTTLRRTIIDPNTGLTFREE